jgi:hypothetical protein
MTCYSVSLFIFLRDQGLRDNTGLHEALRLSSHVTPFVGHVRENRLSKARFKEAAGVAQGSK